MALFGQRRDISFFRHVSRELMNRIISQEVGYYKLVLDKTPINSYGESKDKRYYNPVLLTTIIDRNNQNSDEQEYGATTSFDKRFRFLRDDLIEIGLYPERGDIVMYNEDYYEVDNVIENQFIVGKVPEYSLQSDLEKFGSSWSIICECHLTSISKLNLVKNR